MRIMTTELQDTVLYWPFQWQYQSNVNDIDDIHDDSDIADSPIDSNIDDSRVYFDVDDCPADLTWIKGMLILTWMTVM